MKNNADKPSIFNDVLGPVMIGPSSSHVAGASRIGRMARALLSEETLAVAVEFPRDGSLVTTYHSQGTDMGFAAGLMGMEPDDPDTPRALERVRDFVPLTFEIIDEAASHPNDYKIRVISARGERVLRAVSTGGGMIEVRELCGFPISLRGDCYEFFALAARPVEGGLRIEKPAEAGGHFLYRLSSGEPLDEELIARLQGADGIEATFFFPPVLPVRSFGSYSFPFASYAELIALEGIDALPLSHFARAYERARSHLDDAAVTAFAGRILSVMERAIEYGMTPRQYPDRILHAQAHLIAKAERANRLVADSLSNRIIANVSAVMEAKSSMHPIVAAPTAGACGCLAGTLAAVADAAGAPEGARIDALLAAGLIGVFFAGEATFAAEAGGCQMECGAASGMAAAALAEIAGGTARDALKAASMALQAVTGLACDPVAGRVESPCLNKNIMAGVNALAAANMALAGYDEVIPLDETIGAIYEIGKSLPASLRCTLGGLGCTQASRKLAATLAERD